MTTLRQVALRPSETADKLVAGMERLTSKGEGSGALTPQRASINEEVNALVARGYVHPAAERD